MSIDDQDEMVEIEVSTNEEIPETNSKEPPPDTLRILEAILFASEEIMPASRLKTILPDNPDARQIRKMVDKINEILQKERHPFEIVEIGGGYQFRTVSYYHPWVRQIFKEKAAKKLSIQSLECLAIIAYKQPLSKAEIEAIRGVVSDGAMKTLLEKRLVTITGRSDKPGRPLQYGTTTEFLKYFGLNKIEDLPRLEEFEAIAREKISELSIDELQTESQTTPAGEEAVEIDGESSVQEQKSEADAEQTTTATVEEKSFNPKNDNVLDTIEEEVELEEDTTYKYETVKINTIEPQSEEAEVFEKVEEDTAKESRTADSKKVKVTYTDGFEIQDDITDEELTETTLQLRDAAGSGNADTRVSKKSVEPDDEALFDQKTEIIFTEESSTDSKPDDSDEEGGFEITLPPSKK